MYSQIDEAIGISNGSVRVAFVELSVQYSSHAGLGNMEGRLGKASILAWRLWKRGHDLI